MKLFSILCALFVLSLSPALADGPAPIVDNNIGNDPAPVEDKNACLYPEVIGQKPDDVMKGHFPDDAFIRVLQEGQMVTMEYREGRINLTVDKNGIITSVTCG